MKFFEIKIQLKHITKPPVWRKLRIPANMSFAELHDLIQISMGWLDGHLHQFRAKTPTGMVSIIMDEEDLDLEGDYLETEVMLEKFLKNPKDKVEYLYDFGDTWEHEITLENVVETAEPLPAPFILSGKGACPPEDCGGVPGYERLKEVMANPKLKDNKEEYKMFSEWLGLKTWDAEELDIDGLNEDMEDYLKELMEEIIEDREPEDLLVNLSNHPKDTWSKEQLKEAKKLFGEVVDLPFPNVAPNLSEQEVVELASEYMQKVFIMNPAAVHVMGDMNFTFMFIIMAEQMGIPCYASTSERNVLMTKDGKKEVSVKFVQFRKYLLKPEDN